MTTNKNYDETSSTDDQPIVVEHAGILEDQNGVEHIVLMDHTGYAEVRTVEDDRWDCEWKEY